jgi:hypothetical protein
MLSEEELLVPLVFSLEACCTPQAAVAASSGTQTHRMLCGHRAFSVAMVHHNGAARWAHEARSALPWPCTASLSKP